MRGRHVFFIAVEGLRLIKIDIAEVWQNVLDSCAKPSDYCILANGVICYTVGRDLGDIYYAVESIAKSKSVFVGKARRKLAVLKTQNFEITGIATCRQYLLVAGISPFQDGQDLGHEGLTYELLSTEGMFLDVYHCYLTTPLTLKPRHLKLVAVAYSVLGIVARAFGQVDIIAIIHRKVNLITTVSLPALAGVGEYHSYYRATPTISSLTVNKVKKSEYRILLTSNWSVMIANLAY